MLVHDGDVMERFIAAPQPPLVLEHLNEHLLEIFLRRRRTRPSRFALAIEQQRIKESPARITVDFDEMHAVAVQMEVVAGEYAFGSAARFVYFVMPPRQWHRPLHRIDHSAHL